MIVALLTSACAVSVPRATPPETVSAADQEACEGLAKKTEGRSPGTLGLLLAGAAVGAGGGALAALLALAKSDSPTDVEERGRDMALVAAAFVAVGALTGATVATVMGAGDRQAAYAEAMDVCLRPVLLTRELGPEHPELARSLHALAYRYYREAEFARAEPLYVQALAIQEKRWGADAPEVATILDDYAALLRQTGRAAEAARLEQRAKAIRAKQ